MESKGFSLVALMEIPVRRKCVSILWEEDLEFRGES